jgi:hypothetical protein
MGLNVICLMNLKKFQTISFYVFKIIPTKFDLFGFPFSSNTFLKNLKNLI